MPKPINKSELLAESQAEYEALEGFLAGLTPEQMAQPGALGEWAVKDVLAHLLEWQAMFLGWYAAGLRGETPRLPHPDYKWNQTPALNQMIFEKHCARPLDEILAEFRASHQQTMALAEELSEDDLFTAGRFPWANPHRMATFFTSTLGSHYRWARTGIRKSLAPKRKQGTT